MKLYHFFKKRGERLVSHWHLTQGGEAILDTGSSVVVLRALRRLGLQIPEIMGGPEGFRKEWQAEW